MSTEVYDPVIVDELQTALASAVAASSTPTLPVSYIGRTFTPPNDQKYVEFVWIANNPPDDYWGDEQNYMGMFRLVLHWPNNDEGAITPLGVLASICSYFSKSLALPSVRISDKPKVASALQNGTEILYPASVRYSCFRP